MSLSTHAITLRGAVLHSLHQRAPQVEWCVAVRIKDTGVLLEVSGLEGMAFFSYSCGKSLFSRAESRDHLPVRILDCLCLDPVVIAAFDVHERAEVAPVNPNPYLRSQDQCVFHEADCECLLGQPCQLVPPPTAASKLARAEHQAIDLVETLNQVQNITPSGSGLATVTATVESAKSLELMVHELRRDTPA